MKAEIIACGTELLLGHNIDTNTAYLSKVLSYLGIEVYHHSIVGDNRERLSLAIADAESRSDIVIITGGLGPTIDDITMGTLANVAKLDLFFNKKVFGHIKEYFNKRLSKLPKGAIKQALIPRGASWFLNKVGTAPGLVVKHEDKKLIALPGPPRELIPMVKRDLIPYLKKLQDQSWTIKSRTLKLIGMPEINVNEKVSDLLELTGDITMGIYTHLGEVELRITVRARTEKSADSAIKKIENKIKKKFGDIIYAADNETLPDVVGRMLVKSKKSIAIAESCTGGYVSHLITNTPGSSNYFILGLTAYSNTIKIEKLKIDKALIKKQGVVSKHVAKSMAENVREMAGSDIGLGITGIAGPSGGSKKKPVGLVFIAISSKKKGLVKEFRFQGSREEIKIQTGKEALNLLRLNL